MADFTYDRALINKGKHLTKGRRDRYISDITHAIFEQDQKQQALEAIWSNIKDNPKNPSSVVTEDFVWSLFGRIQSTTPVDFIKEPRDVKTFCLWLQHSPPLRGWFNAILNDNDWNPERVAIKFSQKVYLENVPKSKETMKNFAQQHEFELMRYAPLLFAERVNHVLEQLGEDQKLSEKEAGMIAKALSNTTVHPFIEVHEEKLRILLNFDDHNGHIEMYIATNPEWVALLSNVDWVSSQSQPYLHKACKLFNRIQEGMSPLDILDDEDLDEVTAYFLVKNYWDEISPKAQMGWLRYFFNSWFGFFKEDYQKAVQKLNNSSIVLGSKMEYQEAYDKSPKESFESFFLRSIEKAHLEDLKEDKKELAGLVFGIADGSTVTKLDEKIKLGAYALHDEDQSFTSGEGGRLASEKSQRENILKEKSQAATSNIEEKEEALPQSSSGGVVSSSKNDSSSNDNQSNQIGLNQPQSAFEKRMLANPTTRKEVITEYAKKGDIRKLALIDVDTSVMLDSKSAANSSGKYNKTHSKGFAEQRLKELNLQGLTTQFLARLFLIRVKITKML